MRAIDLCLIAYYGHCVICTRLSACYGLRVLVDITGIVLRVLLHYTGICSFCILGLNGLLHITNFWPLHITALRLESYCIVRHLVNACYGH